MKLDKIKFAVLVAFIVEEAHNGFDDNAIAKLDDLIDVELPIQPPASMMNAETLHVMMALMAEGTRKIEAIKQHRMMTGYGLKESKDIVEMYWRPKPVEPATLGDILGKATERPPVNFDKFEG